MPGVAAVDDVVGLARAARAGRPPPRPPSVADARAEPLDRLAGRVDVLGVEEAADAGLARRRARRRGATRCEIDLSPGTSMEPRSGPLRRQVSGPFKRAPPGPRAPPRARSRAASGDSAMAARMRDRWRSSRARRLGQVRVAARHLALDVEGERGEAGHVLQARAGEQRGRAGPASRAARASAEATR